MSLTADPITGFWGEYRFLSNFFPVDVVLDGEAYPSVEHAYQAAKLSPSDAVGRDAIRCAATPGQAKRLGSNAVPRAGWDDMKVAIMRDLLRQKFTRPDLAARLLTTGDADLIEGNSWGDRFWGQSPVGDGENRLGRLLMEIRRDIAEQSPLPC